MIDKVGAYFDHKAGLEWLTAARESLPALRFKVFGRMEQAGRKVKKSACVRRSGDAIFWHESKQVHDFGKEERW